MRFKSFKGFGIGKAKDGPASEKPAAPKSPARGDKTGGRDLEEQAPDLQGILSDGENAGPHGPLIELSIGPEDLADDDPADVLTPTQEDEGEKVKMVQVKASKDAAPPAPEPKPEADKLDLGDSLSGLFANDEEEENPLANLIKSLPNYTTHEIIEDLKEIKRIIQEWQRE